jgi:hypothetical protein
MKKKLIMIIFLLLLVIFLVGCRESAERVFDAGQYTLSYAEIDGHELELSELYPSGAYLLLCADGTGRLILGENACEITWRKEEENLTVLIEEIEASGKDKNGTLTLAFGPTGLIYTFTEGEYSPDESFSEDRERNLQNSWSGSWSGRIWFEEVHGKWADFEDRTMAAEVTVSMDANGKGSLILYNPFYSKELPMMTLRISAEEQNLKCESGYFMSFPVTDDIISFEINREMASEIETTQIIFPNEYAFGHIYFEDDLAEDYEMDVFRIRGRCGDADGYFRYKIVLTR